MALTFNFVEYVRNALVTLPLLLLVALLGKWMGSKVRTANAGLLLSLSP